MAAKTRPISAPAAARASQPGVRRRSQKPEATVVMTQPAYMKVAAGTWTYMSRTESAISASAGLTTRPYRTSSARLASAAQPSTRVARDPVWAGARPAGAAPSEAGAPGGPVGGAAAGGGGEDDVGDEVADGVVGV